MKTISARTDPAFKRTQLLPVIHNLVPPATGGAARQFAALTPPTTATEPKATIVLTKSATNNTVGRCQLR
ncbi:MAG TPA: hypothetical protein VFZ59_06870 [Verrucomicrobiae bacterium]|nr:hypothetical protein [Verrucomicrobiae bacterium]